MAGTNSASISPRLAARSPSARSQRENPRPRRRGFGRANGGARRGGRSLDREHKDHDAPGFGNCGSNHRVAVFVILTKRATRAAGRISDSFAPAKPVPVLKSRKRSFAEPFDRFDLELSEWS